MDLDLENLNRGMIIVTRLFQQSKNDSSVKQCYIVQFYKVVDRFASFRIVCVELGRTQERPYAGLVRRGGSRKILLGLDLCLDLDLENLKRGMIIEVILLDPLQNLSKAELFLNAAGGFTA